jgi:hypothetical protein
MYIAPVNSETRSQDILLGMEQEGKPFLASFSESSHGVVIKISDRLQLNQSFKDSHEKYCRWLPPEVRVRSFIPDHYDMHAEYIEIEVIKGNALYRPGCLFRLTPIQAFVLIKTVQLHTSNDLNR